MPNLHVEREVKINACENAIFIIGGGTPMGRASWQVQEIMVKSDDIAVSETDKKVKVI